MSPAYRCPLLVDVIEEFAHHFHGHVGRYIGDQMVLGGGGVQHQQMGRLQIVHGDRVGQLGAADLSNDDRKQVRVK